MKKILYLFLAITLLLSFTLGGCSCNPSTPLVFSPNFLGKDASGNTNTINSSYTETLTYKVEYEAEYDTLKKSQSITEDLSNVYQNGLYVSEFKVFSSISTAGSTLDSGAIKDITNIDDSNQDYAQSEIYYIKNKLSLDVVKDGYNNTDTIESHVYFYPAGLSFAPIYSYTQMKMTYMFLNNGKLEPKTYVYQFEFFYNTNNFSCVKKFYDFTKEDVKDFDFSDSAWTSKLQNMPGSGNSKEYTARQVIDNNQLLFAIRSLNIASGNSQTLPTTNYTYGDKKDLSVSNKNDGTTTLNFNYNGTPITDLAMPVKNMSFVIGGTDNVGSQKYITVQKEKVDGSAVENTALPIKYVEGIVESSSYNTIGVLEYTLTDVNITR